MKILLINPRMSSTSQPPLGLVYLSAYLKANDFQDVVIIDTAWENLTERLESLAFSPDIVGIQVMTPYFTRARYVIDAVRVKFPQAILVVGGPHPSAARRQTLTGLNPDYGVIGEGEETFLELVKTVAEQGDPKKIAGVFYADANGEFKQTSARNVIGDLDQIPFPDRDSLPMKFYLRRGIMQEFGFKSLRATTILTSRGCPFQCIYCPLFWPQGQIPQPRKCYRGDKIFNR